MTLIALPLVDAAHTRKVHYIAGAVKKVLVNIDRTDPEFYLKLAKAAIRAQETFTKKYHHTKVSKSKLRK